MLPEGLALGEGIHTLNMLLFIPDASLPSKPFLGLGDIKRAEWNVFPVLVYAEMPPLLETSWRISRMTNDGLKGERRRFMPSPRQFII